ncbi:MAG TPA: chemotaxis protein CheB [Nitrospiria bacterium]|jgi:two-component system CheB/CheR fusion protein|nr:chemotaxis protein CheB [Nitrospiria bacterium]
MGTLHPNFIVGIGGSAGGLDAYTVLLDALPSNTGMAFVIISHILPTTAHSMLAELLTSHTKMPVIVVSDAMPIEADHIYVIPPDADLFIEGNTFKAVSPRTMNKQIDIFLISLAAAMGARAIGVIVSGYDGDGSEGCKQIKAKGGKTFAQDTSAKVPGMPESARASGSVDFVLPPDKIAAELQRLASASINKRS